LHPTIGIYVWPVGQVGREIVTLHPTSGISNGALAGQAAKHAKGTCKWLQKSGLVQLLSVTQPNKETIFKESKNDNGSERDKAAKFNDWLLNVWAVPKMLNVISKVGNTPWAKSTTDNRVTLKDCTQATSHKELALIVLDK